MTPLAYRFRPLSVSDLPLVGQWLNHPHVAEWWGDPVHGLAPITKLFDLIHVMVVNADLKVKTVDELVALSKAKPGTLSYLTPGAPMVLYMETLKKEHGADWVRVPFKGGGEAVNAILSGFTPIGLFGEGNVIGQIRAGTMTPLVMLNNIHSPNFPQVPTLKETGYNRPPSRGWYGLFAPAANDCSTKARMNALPCPRPINAGSPINWSMPSVPIGWSCRG